MIQKNNVTSEYLYKIVGDYQPSIGVILGTGLGKFVNNMTIDFEINYEDIPNFLVSTVPSHHGKLLFGKINNKKIVCMQGRFHFYEGHSMQNIALPIIVMKQMGIKHLFVCNAAGGLNPAYNLGDIMLIEDHISLFMPENPLFGSIASSNQFPDMAEPYNRLLISKAKEIALKQNFKIEIGTYVFVSGPQLGTKAEYKLLRQLGADAVGMSTVPEVIVARKLNLSVFGISVITDKCFSDIYPVSFKDILHIAQAAEPTLAILIKELINDL